MRGPERLALAVAPRLGTQREELGVHDHESRVASPRGSEEVLTTFRHFSTQKHPKIIWDKEELS